MSVTRATASGVAALFTLAAAAGAAQSAQQTSPSADYLLMTGRAGRIELGMSVDEVYQLFGRDNVSLVAEFREGMFSPVLKVRISGATAIPAISIDIREWPCGEFSVWGIVVFEPRFRTQDGFGVGSTAGELRRSYLFQMNEAEGGHSAMVKALQMSFGLTRQGPIDQQRVTAVGIWPDPDAVKKKRCPGHDDVIPAGS